PAGAVYTDFTFRKQAPLKILFSSSAINDSQLRVAVLTLNPVPSWTYLVLDVSSFGYYFTGGQGATSISISSSDTVYALVQATDATDTARKILCKTSMHANHWLLVNPDVKGGPAIAVSASNEDIIYLSISNSDESYK